MIERWPILWTDLKELKATLEIDPCDTAQDKKLNFLNEWISSIFEEFLDRPGFFLKERTEYYAGTGTQKLLLRSRPVYISPAIQVFVDQSGGYYGQASGAFAANTALTFGTDFILWTDGEENQKSRSGVLLRLNDYWPRPMSRQRGLLTPFVGQDMGSIKVIYNGGYTIDDMPATLRFAANLFITRLNNLFPLGELISSEAYEERAITYFILHRDMLFGLVRPFLMLFKNWHY